MAVSIARHLTRVAFKHVELMSAVRCQCHPAAVQRRNVSMSQAWRARFFTEAHEWVSIENGSATVGISDYAQEKMGEVVYVELPEVGAELAAGDIAGCVESVKSASDIFSPMSGEVSEVNSSLTDAPMTVNKSPLDKGWLFKLKLQSSSPTEGMMDEDAYNKLVGTLE